MKIPKKLNIAGHSYKVMLKERLKDGTTSFGTHDGKLSTIWIDSDLSVSQSESTLIHEIIEAVNFMNQIGLSENQINVLETGLYQILKDNNLLK